MEQLKAQLQREQAGVDLSDIKSRDKAMSRRGNDDSNPPAEDQFSVRTSEGSRFINAMTTGNERSVIDSNRRVQGLKVKNVPKRGNVRYIASSTSYRAMGEYDRDYVYDEDSGDFSEEMGRKEEVELGGISDSSKHVPTTQRIVTIPLDLTDSGSAVHVMSELKRMGIDDKVRWVSQSERGEGIRPDGRKMTYHMRERADACRFLVQKFKTILSKPRDRQLCYVIFFQFKLIQIP